MKRGFVPLACVLLAAAACQQLPATNASATGGEQQTALAVVPVRITTQTGAFMFKAELAQTEDQQARGLMFREQLAPDAGMLFPMMPPREASFWMRNTVIPLDMIFIRTDGTIARIAAQTVPYSLEPVTSGESVGAVLEIAGGRAAELGIREGDKVKWPVK